MVPPELRRHAAYQSFRDPGNHRKIVKKQGAKTCRKVGPGTPNGEPKSDLKSIKIIKNEDSKRDVKKVSFWDLPDPPDRGSRVGGSVIFTKSACSKSDPKKLPELGRKSTESQ